MQSTAAVISPPAPPKASTEIWDFAEECLQRTAGILQDTRSATPAQLSQAVGAARASHAQGIPMDILEAVARVQGHAEEHIGPVILALGDRVATAVTPYAPLIPFAGKLIAPSAFYESFERLHQIARALLSPVIFAEDSDAIGTASANPVASVLLAEEIRNSVHKRLGIRPFVTIARFDYESWTFLCRKHFEL